MRYFNIILLVVSLVLGACSNEYQKALKNPDNRLKLEMADAYYKKKDFVKAVSLYEQVEDAFSGTPTAGKILYNSAQCNFGLKMYALSGFQFKTYFENFPTGENAEEALYMNAYCAYLESMEPELDQTDTYKALETFRIFINVYPESKYVPECNNYMDKLRAKLSFKAYRTAKLYYDMGEYKSAIVALKNISQNFPEMIQKEEVDFLVVKSNYLLAQNSIEEKQKERFQNTIVAFEEFSEAYTEGSKYMKDAKEIQQKAILAIKKIDSKKS
ncbi:MAG: outer membrane protein assembly factor BamD [Bacteroidia bacterium]|nr:outer membrane protein assembly factor BamD [Bacteroidia bacterium]MCF8425591.1 outer membrane protein assembly factor BamD [Bacteroidia bacterium]MCF8445706.1 outer membrane protein assembly factor BamD [Bacteroidia bacterium]